MPTANATTSVTATLMPTVASVPRPLWPEDASRLEVPDAAGTEAAEEGSAFTEFDERLGDEVWLAGSFEQIFSSGLHAAWSSQYCGARTDVAAVLSKNCDCCDRCLP
jgi:hypothetical protein